MFEKEEGMVGISAIVGRHIEKYLYTHKNGKIPEGVYGRVIDAVEMQLIRVTLRYTQGNQVKAAKILGIDRNTLRRKIIKHKLDDEL